MDIWAAWMPLQVVLLIHAAAMNGGGRPGAAHIVVPGAGCKGPRLDYIRHAISPDSFREILHRRPPFPLRDLL